MMKSPATPAPGGKRDTVRGPPAGRATDTPAGSTAARTPSVTRVPAPTGGRSQRPLQWDVPHSCDIAAKYTPTNKGSHINIVVYL